MRITRRQFLGATTAFTAVGLFGMGLTSSPIDPEHLRRDRWYSVWYQPFERPPVRMGRFSGIERYPLPENSFLTLDSATMARLRTARAGEGLKGEVTTHIVPDQDRDFFG